MQLEEINDFSKVFNKFSILQRTLHTFAMFFYERVIIINNKF